MVQSLKLVALPALIIRRSSVILVGIWSTVRSIARTPQPVRNRQGHVTAKGASSPHSTKPATTTILNGSVQPESSVTCSSLSCLPTVFGELAQHSSAIANVSYNKSVLFSQVHYDGNCGPAELAIQSELATFRFQIVMGLRKMHSPTCRAALLLGNPSKSKILSPCETGNS